MAEIQIKEAGRRTCGDCQLCCRLLPVRELGKVAGVKCDHQKFGKGCAVYHKPAMPHSCRLWHCRWLINDDAAELSRPDRSHYVIDLMPDFVTLRHNDTDDKTAIQVVQIWCDPKYPDAHRDPALRRWLLRRGKQHIAAIIRYDSARAMVLFPPNMASDGTWHEMTTGVSEHKTHSLDDIEQALSEQAAKDSAA